MENGSIKIKNLMGDQDAKMIAEALNHVWGIEKVNLDVNKQELHYSYDSRMASQEDFEQAVKELGFELR